MPTFAVLLLQALIPAYWMYCAFALLAGFGQGGSVMLNFVIAVELYVLDAIVPIHCRIFKTTYASMYCSKLCA
jgi:hypothetical protein